MLSFEIKVRRGDLLYPSTTGLDLRVENYQKELKEFTDFLRHAGYDLRELLGNKDFLDKTAKAIEEELDYCRFYWHLKRMKTRPGYLEWVFYSGNEAKAKDVAEGKSWTSPAAYNDRWVRFDGKTVATIEADRSGIMTKLLLYVENDRHLYYASENIEACNLKFVSGREELDTAHLKNEAAIGQRIGEMKEHGADFQNKHQYPLYLSERADAEALDALLHIK